MLWFILTTQNPSFEYFNVKCERSILISKKKKPHNLVPWPPVASRPHLTDFLLPPSRITAPRLASRCVSASGTSFDYQNQRGGVWVRLRLSPPCASRPSRTNTQPPPVLYTPSGRCLRRQAGLRPLSAGCTPNRGAVLSGGPEGKNRSFYVFIRQDRVINLRAGDFMLDYNLQQNECLYVETSSQIGEWWRQLEHDDEGRVGAAAGGGAAAGWRLDESPHTELLPGMSSGWGWTAFSKYKIKTLNCCSLSWHFVELKLKQKNVQKAKMNTAQKLKAKMC